MKIYMTVLGILMLLCGICCVATPMLTFVGTGYFLIILLLVYGIMNIIRGLENKNFGLNFVFGIVSTVLGILILAIPGLRGLTVAVVLYIIAAWFVVRGIIAICEAVKVKKSDTGNMWIFGIVVGILAILLGVYSALHPLVLVFSLEWLVSLYFIISGLDAIAVAMRYSEE